MALPDGKSLPVSGKTNRNHNFSDATGCWLQIGLYAHASLRYSRRQHSGHRPSPINGEDGCAASDGFNISGAPIDTANDVQNYPGIAN